MGRRIGSANKESPVAVYYSLASREMRIQILAELIMARMLESPHLPLNSSEEV